MNCNSLQGSFKNMHGRFSAGGNVRTETFHLNNPNSVAKIKPSISWTTFTVRVGYRAKYGGACL